MWLRKLTTMAMSTSKESIQTAVKTVLEKMAVATEKRAVPNLPKPRLVAVSKTKPVEDIIAAYDAGQRHFGENYVHELVEKSKDTEILDKCTDIQWHFIGHLQRNKVSKVVLCPNIFTIETIESEKLAEAVNRAWERAGHEERLKVMVQVNTSGETNKNGCEPDDTLQIVQYVREKCPKLELIGLMTIGSFDHDISKGPNPDFQKLIECRDRVSKETGIPIDQLEVSMGMSHDYEHAIELGSTNVRVGSTIFGARQYTNKSGPGNDINQSDSVNSVESGVKNMSVKDS